MIYELKCLRAVTKGEDGSHIKFGMLKESIYILLIRFSFQNKFSSDDFLDVAVLIELVQLQKKRIKKTWKKETNRSDFLVKFIQIS